MRLPVAQLVYLVPNIASRSDAVLESTAELPLSSNTIKSKLLTNHQERETWKRTSSSMRIAASKDKISMAFLPVWTLRCSIRCELCNFFFLIEATNRLPLLCLLASTCEAMECFWSMHLELNYNRLDWRVQGKGVTTGTVNESCARLSSLQPGCVSWAIKT